MEKKNVKVLPLTTVTRQCDDSSCLTSKVDAWNSCILVIISVDWSRTVPLLPTWCYAMFGPSLGRVWMSRSEVKVTRDKKRHFRPFRQPACSLFAKTCLASRIFWFFIYTAIKSSQLIFVWNFIKNQRTSMLLSLLPNYCCYAAFESRGTEKCNITLGFYQRKLRHIYRIVSLKWTCGL